MWLIRSCASGLIGDDFAYIPWQCMAGSVPCLQELTQQLSKLKAGLDSVWSLFRPAAPPERYVCIYMYIRLYTSEYLIYYICTYTYAKHIYLCIYI
jgi:hypothetical protein